MNEVKETIRKTIMSDLRLGQHFTVYKVILHSSEYSVYLSKAMDEAEEPKGSAPHRQIVFGVCGEDLDPGTPVSCTAPSWLLS